jgi:serine/threonine protein kinase
VILASDGPRVIDFGIARALEATSHITSRGVVGTPGFMSPEQAYGGDVDTPSDVFSLGAVLAFAATGHCPFGTGRIEAIVYRVIHDEPDLAGLPAHLVDLVAACLAKDPDHRPSVADLLDRLAEPARTSTRWLPQHVLGVADSAAESAATAATAQDHRVVRIRTLHDKCLDVLGAARHNHTPIIQHDCHGGPNQIFTLVPTGDGRHQIRTMHDKCLEVPFGWVDNNVTIVQHDDYDGTNQRFWIRDVGDGKVEIRTVHYKSLDVPGGLSDNIPIIQYDWHGGANQQFRLEDI